MSVKHDMAALNTPGQNDPIIRWIKMVLSPFVAENSSQLWNAVIVILIVSFILYKLNVRRQLKTYEEAVKLHKEGPKTNVTRTKDDEVRDTLYADARRMAIERRQRELDEKAELAAQKRAERETRKRREKLGLEEREKVVKKEVFDDRNIFKKRPDTDDSDTNLLTGHTSRKIARKPVCDSKGGG